MPYSRSYLKEISQPDNFGSYKHKATTEDLMNKLFEGEELTLAEEEYVCGSISILHSEEKRYHFDTFDYEGCKNYNFRTKYLTYYSDLNCYNRSYDFKGELTSEQRGKDRDFLESEYQEWYQKIINERQLEKLMDYVSKETKHHIKLIERHCRETKIGSFRKEYLIKSIVLQSKFIFLLVKEFLQEFGSDEDIFDFYDRKILLDGYSYVHILFRHYSEAIKVHQVDKTYHYDQNIDYKTIPQFLKSVILAFQAQFPAEAFNGRSIDFVFNNITYSIWFRPFTVHKPGKVVEKYLRVQTLYPVGLPSDIVRLQDFQKVKVDEYLTFLIQQPD